MSETASTVIPNEMKRRIIAGERVASLNVNRWKSVDIAEIAALAGFEWLFMDLEHGALNEEMAGQIAMMALRTGVTPIARVGTDQWYQASRLLDAGCQGIVFPHVDDVEQARAAVAASKYPPVGTRSLTSPLPQARYGRAGSREAMAALNAETLTITMIETERALSRLDDIASVAGVDALLIGTNDLAADFGFPGELGHDKVAAAYESVREACHRHGLFFGMGGVYGAPLITRYLRMGVQFMLGGADVSLLMDAAKARRQMIASCEGG